MCQDATICTQLKQRRPVESKNYPTYYSILPIQFEESEYE